MIARDDYAGRQAEAVRERKMLAAAEDKRPITERLFSLWLELKAAGWREMIYAPKDGTEIEIIEMGSTGIFKAVWCSFGHEPLDNCGSFFAQDGHDSYPSDPLMWRPVKPMKS